MSLDSRRNSKPMMLPGVRREPYRNRFKSDLEGLTPALTAARVPALAGWIGKRSGGSAGISSCESRRTFASRQTPGLVKSHRLSNC
jgi:hypothetical protein